MEFLTCLFFFLQTTSPTGHGRSDSPVYTNLQELKISQSSLPPIPSGSPLHILGDWETHKDLSGRYFYYNRATGERTWKPPRTRDTSSSTSTISVRGDSQGTAESEVNFFFFFKICGIRCEEEVRVLAWKWILSGCDAWTEGSFQLMV